MSMRKIGEFIKTFGQVGEARLILLAALVIADELSDANEALQQERSRGRAAGGSGRQSEPAKRPHPAFAASPSASKPLRRASRHPR